MRTALVRWSLRTALAAVVLLFIVGLVVYLNLSRLARQSVERHTTRSLNLTTTVRAASLRLLGGSQLHLDDFRIASPPGFSPEPLIVLGGADLVLPLSQLRSNPVHITSITLADSRLLVENVNHRLNFKQMVDDLPPASARPLRLKIDELTVRNATVVLRPGLAGMPREIVVPIPTFTLHGIGTDDAANPDGVLVKDVVTQLVTALVAHASNAEELPPDLRLLLKGDVHAIVRTLGAAAQARLAGVVPGDLGRVFGALFDTPAKEKATGAGSLFHSLIGRPSSRPATGSTTAPDSIGDR